MSSYASHISSISLSPLPPNIFLQLFFSPPLLSFYSLLVLSQFLDYLDEVWKPGVIAARVIDDIKFAKKFAEDQRKAEERRKAGEEAATVSDTESFVFTADEIPVLKCDYIVIGPNSSPLQAATGQNTCCHSSLISSPSPIFMHLAHKKCE